MDLRFLWCPLTSIRVVFLVGWGFSLILKPVLHLPSKWLFTQSLKVIDLLHLCLVSLIWRLSLLFTWWIALFLLLFTLWTFHMGGLFLGLVLGLKLCKSFLRLSQVFCVILLLCYLNIIFIPLLDDGVILEEFCALIFLI